MPRRSDDVSRAPSVGAYLSGQVACQPDDTLRHSLYLTASDADLAHQMGRRLGDANINTLVRMLIRDKAREMGLAA